MASAFLFLFGRPAAYRAQVPRPVLSVVVPFPNEETVLPLLQKRLEEITPRPNWLVSDKRTIAADFKPPGKLGATGLYCLTPFETKLPFRMPKGASIMALGRLTD